MTVPIHAQIRVTGQVQGVGFRPFVYRLAHELGLAGWVRNDSEGVEISVEGERPQVMSLIARLQSEPPALARVENITHEFSEVENNLHGFTISASKSGRVHTGITPDSAICADCLHELFDPADRRYRHPFINCIHCGPRYTLTARMPYDRANTSMAKFVQCPQCQAEYDSPTTRRFHAQPNACPQCGPSLQMFDAQWQRVATDDPAAASAERIRAGQVVAIKGIGGFHLVCDARNAAAVARLRGGKQREEKPFAVMVLNTNSARHYAEFISNSRHSGAGRNPAETKTPRSGQDDVDLLAQGISFQLDSGLRRNDGLNSCGMEPEATLLESPERPIVLLRQSSTCATELQGIAPGLSSIGLMLPYTPLQYLLFHELLGKPQGSDWLQQETKLALVMTSANPGGEPLVKNDAEARESLSTLADAFLTHNRDILHRCDDSVMKWQANAPAFIRRARGFTPRRITLPCTGPSILACGAWLKNTVCLTRGNEAFVSQHIGDLDHAGARQMLDDTVAHLCDILDVQPQAVAHDLHPDFYSTQFAQNFAAQHNLPLIGVQHHHAHIAALCAEHRLTEPVLGLALDGVGLGSDGSAWGGELLRVEGADFQRLGHLAPLTMPGGDRAAREPWRMAAAVLFDMGRGDEIVRRFPHQAGAATIVSMLQRQTSNVGASLLAKNIREQARSYNGQAPVQSRLNCPPTTSAGRLFDAAAGLLGISEIQAYEGQAAMLLQGMAERHGRVAPLADGYTLSDDGVLDFYPLLAALADSNDAAHGAALFHATLAAGLAAWAQRATVQCGFNHVALGGGCFLNAVLTEALHENLTAHSLHVLTAQRLPPNDGAIALGQAWVAMQRINQGD
ncbi:MAG: carbamoyltransferase HypF [Sideroxydans sp.]|nr:carbamoyltransferase HypF [Sideroxydans sp.]